MTEKDVLDTLIIMCILPTYIIVIGFIYLYSYTSNTYEERVKNNKKKKRR